MRKSFVAIIVSASAVILGTIILILCLVLIPRTDGNKEVSQDPFDNDLPELVVQLKRTDDYNNFTIEDIHKRDSITIDGGGTSWQNLYIVTDAKEFNLRNLNVVNDNGGIGIKIITTNATVELQNVSVKMNSKSGVALQAQSGTEIKIAGLVDLIGGDGLVSQNGGCALDGVGALTIGGDGTLNLIGGNGGAGRNGIRGQDGRSYDTALRKAEMFEHGSHGADGGNGTNGGNGQQAGMGGDALSCTNLSIQGTVSINCLGGNSNKSGDGAQGGDGGDGEGACSGNPWQIEQYNGGRGGDAGDGGNGGDESRPGYGIICKKATIEKSAKVSASVGKRGSAGTGGAPGNPGSGGESMGGSFNDWNGTSDGESGASGKNGKAGAALSDEEIFAYKIDSLDGEIAVENMA